MCASRMSLCQGNEAGEDHPHNAMATVRPTPFESDEGLLEAALQMLKARREFADGERDEHLDRGKYERAAKRQEAWTQYWHASFQMTSDDVVICSRCNAYGLNKVEREVVVALILDRLALLDTRVTTCEDVLNALVVHKRDVIPTLRALSEYGKLHKSGLIIYRNPDEDIRDREIVVDLSLVDAVLYESGEAKAVLPVITERELYDKLSDLTRAFREKAEMCRAVQEGARLADLFEIYVASYRTDRLHQLILQTLETHTDWRLGKLLNSNGLTPLDQQILLILVGKELGHLDADSELFTGMGLAHAVSANSMDARECLALLEPRSTLTRGAFIQPVGGQGKLLTEDSDALEQVGFELTAKSMGSLKIDKRWGRKRAGSVRIREGKVCMDQLVLSEKVQQALEMALVQIANSHTIMGEWGLGKTIAYGRGVTLLFTGPPGVGKTACAEALARELKRPFLAVDYSEMQSMWVGETDKNIVRAFREARAHDAVLLWDEADAMFYDRDAAVRSWEVRHVNVLLQQLERFDGVCVLATNRKVSLDTALERRITIKAEFERPDRQMRRAIWERLIPAETPISDDVDLDKLSEAGLTGGEIKNVVLNAARFSLSRSKGGPIEMMDFEKAVEMETGGRWSGDSKVQIGFRGAL